MAIAVAFSSCEQIAAPCLSGRSGYEFHRKSTPGEGESEVQEACWLTADGLTPLWWKITSSRAIVAPERGANPEEPNSDPKPGDVGVSGTRPSLAY